MTNKTKGLWVKMLKFDSASDALTASLLKQVAVRREIKKHIQTRN